MPKMPQTANGRFDATSQKLGTPKKGSPIGEIVVFRLQVNRRDKDKRDASEKHNSS